MHSFFLDGSALAKRYVPENGSALVDVILDSVAEQRIYLLNIGYAEVASVLVRKKNAGGISAALFNQALLNLEREVIRSLGKHLLSFDNSVASDALAFIVKHAINSTDAIVLRVALDIAQLLRDGGNDLVLVASDQRLLRAAQAEGLVTFNPESQDQAALAVLIGP
ncbi:MAG TPA: type II toxin-antitoxin system VapC family toxin [Gemmataceae bacterium]|nr:type II toxin-antitoxin system VapC family toxin [Gemmataceae bacterium]